MFIEYYRYSMKLRDRCHNSTLVKRYCLSLYTVVLGCTIFKKQHNSIRLTIIDFNIRVLILVDLPWCNYVKKQIIIIIIKYMHTHYNIHSWVVYSKHWN